MKLLPVLFCICCTISVFAQRNIENELLHQSPNCENVAYNSAQLVDRYFGKKNYDSINVVCNKWEEFCGVTEPVFRLKVLSQIQNRVFSEEWMEQDYLFNYIFLYLDRLEYAKASNSKLVYERYKVSFGYMPLNSPFDDLTVIWANSMLETSTLRPIEKAFCLLYSNQTEAFWKLMKSQEIAGTKLKTLYEEQTSKANKLGEVNMGFMNGVMIPSGNLLEYIGIKPQFGFQFGYKVKKIQYDLSVLLRSGSARKEYMVIYQGEPKITDHYLGGYAGLDLAYELRKRKRNEVDILAGIAYDGFDVVEGDTDNDIKGKSLNSLNLNFGLGYRFCGKKFNYLGLQAKYNVVNYRNKGGTDFNGNYISLILTANLFGNAKRNQIIENYRIKQ
jgi:hypothetical protein